MDIALQRLCNQQIACSTFTSPEELVRRMGCIQAQDYPGGKWAIGCRIKGGCTDAEIERFFNKGKILRTHILRPTWHFISPDDIRWILALTAPKIKKITRAYPRKLGIDKGDIKRSKSIIARALANQGKMTRGELAAALGEGGVKTTEGRIGFLLMDAELDGLICSTGRTYALLDHLVPEAEPLDVDCAIAALARRYFTSRGPATIRDFSWWSGLTLTKARKGVEMNGDFLSHALVRGNEYWFESGQERQTTSDEHLVHLLPPFDEYAVAYADRRDVLDPVFSREAVFGLKPIIVSDGRIVGTWKRSEIAGEIALETNIFDIAHQPSDEAIASACGRYCEFTGKVQTGKVALVGESKLTQHEK